MIRLFRRHRTTCAQTSETYRRCACPIYAEGKVGDERLPKTALNLSSWDAAQKWVRKRESAGTLKLQHEISIEDALKSFIADCEARNLNPSTLAKYRLLERRLCSFGVHSGLSRCADFKTDTLRDFRASWNLSPRTGSKVIDRLRSFFRFCQENGWIEKNPASSIKAGVLRDLPRQPFSSEEQARILLWANAPTTGRAGGKKGVLPPHPHTGVFLKLLLYTGLRITDAATLTKDRIDSGRILLYTQKTGSPVWLPIPADLERELSAIPSSQLFSSPKGSSRGETTSDYWRDQVHKVFEILGIKGTPHVFRHTLAVSMLNNGSSMEDVALVLGNSAAIVEKHYASFCHSRQERVNEQIRKTWKRPIKLVRVK